MLRKCNNTTAIEDILIKKIRDIFDLVLLNCSVWRANLSHITYILYLKCKDGSNKLFSIGFFGIVIAIILVDL